MWSGQFAGSRAGTQPGLRCSTRPPLLGPAVHHTLIPPAIEDWLASDTASPYNPRNPPMKTKHPDSAVVQPKRRDMTRNFGPRIGRRAFVSALGAGVAG